ncbi:MAG: 1-deoxy-D-xylulose 5-phosphate reductoisomerase [Chlamydiia bacterium]|nr:1-deoxy-D-xylulose 5-phosphate reductoisomerase [Chlamydiia bacterium]
MKEKRLIILGSTGSIGESTLRVVRCHSSSFKVVALAAQSNIEKLSLQIKEFSPKIVAVYNKDKAKELQKLFPDVKIVGGLDGVSEVASYKEADLCVSAISGTMGILPTFAAITAGHDIALANKEVLVSAGSLITSHAKKKGVKLLPIDSEQSAIFQCLEGSKTADVLKLILTASGGPFFNTSYEQMKKISIKEALNHPTWNMGAKNTIDSSTLMNKGLEVIEAYHLFDIPLSQIEVVVHPQSLIHSFVEFVDGSLLAQVAENQMVIPIQYAMTYPERKKGLVKPFDFRKFNKFEFFPPDDKKFTCLSLAYHAAKTGGSMPCFMNAANEILVERFLKGQISWLEIGKKLEKLLISHTIEDGLKLETLTLVDKQAREEAKLA